MGGIQNEKGKFPAQSQAKPQGQHSIETFVVLETHLEHLKSVTTLRNGKKIENVTYSNPTNTKMYKPSKLISERLEPLNYNH